MALHAVLAALRLSPSSVSDVTKGCTVLASNSDSAAWSA